MVRLGVHVSIAGGIDKAVDRALDLGCDVFQIFSSNPRSWKSKPISDLERERFVKRFKESGLHMVVDHMPYLPNLASSKEGVYIEICAGSHYRAEALPDPRHTLSGHPFG